MNEGDNTTLEKKSILFIGVNKAGQTTLIKRHLEKDFQVGQAKKTLGIDCFSETYSLPDGTELPFEWMDAGQVAAKSFLSHADVIVLTLDLSNSESQQKTKKFLEEQKIPESIRTLESTRSKEIPIFLAGTKKDEMTTLAAEETLKTAKEAFEQLGLKFQKTFPTSVKDDSKDQNVKNFFRDIIKIILQKLNLIPQEEERSSDITEKKKSISDDTAESFKQNVEILKKELKIFDPPSCGCFPLVNFIFSKKKINLSEDQLDQLDELRRNISLAESNENLKKVLEEFSQKIKGDDKHPLYSVVDRWVNKLGGKKYDDNSFKTIPLSTGS